VWPPGHRRLSRLGQGKGAHGTCLQVEASNLPGRALYDAIGLKREVYRYHYRANRAERQRAL
jgi:ribosomal protein S18 acetylase RimI-like enzyme